MSINYFIKKHKNAVEGKKNRNKIYGIACNAGVEEKDEDETEIKNNNKEEAEKKIMKANDKLIKTNESENEHSPKVQYECNEWNEEREKRTLEGWIQPVTHVLINYFSKIY